MRSHCSTGSRPLGPWTWMSGRRAKEMSAYDPNSEDRPRPRSRLPEVTSALRKLADLLDQPTEREVDLAHDLELVRKSLSREISESARLRYELCEAKRRSCVGPHDVVLTGAEAAAYRAWRAAVVVDQGVTVEGNR